MPHPSHFIPGKETLKKGNSTFLFVYSSRNGTKSTKNDSVRIVLTVFFDR
jgi:hypothetical protein